MASEEIKLVGSFQDNITPQLKKLQRELDAVTRSFTKLGKKIRPVTREMGKLAVSTRSVADNLKSQRTTLEATTRAMRTYTTASRKATSQQKKLRPAKMTPPRTPRGGAPAAGGGMGMVALGAGGAAMGATIGQMASQAITMALRTGFDYGAKVITTVFQKFATAIGERIEDEMSDIQSAGGMFALDKKVEDKNKRLFNNFSQARNMQESLNRELARSAATLPGATSDYVQSAKQLTDTVFGTYVKDDKAFAGLAKDLGGKEGATAQDDITQVLKKFTEQSVLLSQGSKGGMPLGMLLEQLISQDNVNMKSYKKRYKQLRQNPLLANMLEDAEAEINKTGAMSADRFKAVMGALDNALPEEVINSMRNSVAGVTEGIRSAFLDPEVGLLGLGRPLKSMVKSINSFGQYIDKDGKVVQDMGKAAEEQTTVFKLVRDIMAGYGGALGEIAQILPTVFDPLDALANSFLELRQSAINFQQKFTAYSNYFKDEKLDNSGARGAVMAFSKMLLDMGAIDSDQIKATFNQMSTHEANFGAVIPQLFEQLLTSDFADTVGSTIGTAIGTMLSMIGDFFTGAVSQIGQKGFVAGLTKGFKKANGIKAIKDIFGSVFKTMGKLLLLAVQNFPFEAALLGFAAMIPALLAGLFAALPALIATGSTGGLLAGIAGALGTILSLLPPVALALAAIVTLGGGIEGTVRQLSEISGETLSSIGGSFQAFGDVLGVIVGLTGDLFGALGSLLFGVEGTTNGFDMLKVVLTPITAAFQLLEMGLRGLAAVLAWTRMQLTFNPEERKKRREEFEAADGKRAESQGRINAYNASMLGIDQQMKMLTSAVAESQKKDLSATRSAELDSFIIALRASMAQKDPSKDTSDAALKPATMESAAKSKAAIEANGTATRQSMSTIRGLAEAGNLSNSSTAQSNAAILSTVQGFDASFAQVSTSLNGLAFTQSKAVPTVIMPGVGPVSASYAGNTSRTMGLGGAISSEMKNKPAGSHLVIANSSEAVIPAANGFMPGGMSGGGVNVGGITVNVTGGGGDSEGLAEQVAQEIVYAIQKSTYNELYTS